MSIKSRVKRIIQHEGLASTLHTRCEWTGKPALAAAGSGGSIPAGTYFYTAVLSKDGVDHAGGDKASVVCVINDSVTVSGLTVPSGYTCKLYRNTDPTFPTPSLLSSNASFPYTDTAATPGAGSPSTESTEPYEYFTASTIKALHTSLIRADQRITSAGETVLADKKIMIPYNVAAVRFDEITYNSVRYQIQFVDDPVARGGVQLKVLYCREMIP